MLQSLDKVEPWMAFFFQAKSDLNTCMGMGGEIPWTAIRDYAQTYDLDVDQFDDLVRKIRAMEEGVREGEEQIKKEQKTETENQPEK